MPTCSLCQETFTSTRSLFAHLIIAHPGLSFYKCGENRCVRKFIAKNSFRKHLQKRHNFPLHYTGAMENRAVTNVKNVSSSNDENINFNLRLSNTDSAEAETDFNNVNSVFPDQFISSLQRSAEVFVSKLFCNPRFPRNLIQKIIVDLTSMIGSEYLALLRQKVMDIIKSCNCAQNEIPELEIMFEALENPFRHLTSEYLRFKHFSNSTNYIAPVRYEMGKIFRATRYNNIVKGKYVSVYGQYIPLNMVLTKFFELPNALKDTLAYMESLNKENSGLHNFIQGLLWTQKRKKYLEEDIVLSLFVYFDDLEVNNPLGSHSGKLGAVYVSLPCLPPECRSLLKNIFLVLLFESWTRSYFTNKVTFSPLITILKLLESEGILVQSSQGLKRVFFVLGLITGDNLGLNGLLGMVESFSAHFFCRFCKMHKKDTQQSQKGATEEPALFRNVLNYDNDIQLCNVSETGLKEECVFNDISSFHMTDNYSVDELHDGREGLCNIDMIHILRNLTDGKYKCFDLESLNNRIHMFNYGPKHSLNKPPYISIDHLKKKKLKMTGSEMLCFVRLFGVIVGDLVNEDNPYWQLYLLMRQILDIILAKRLSRGSTSRLKVLIQEHHELFVSLTGDTLTPKMHILTHYPRIIEQSGPTSHLSTIRNEAKHRDLTQAAAANMSRLNIAHSLAVKHQMSMCHRFLSNEGLIPDMQTGPGHIMTLHDMLPFIQTLPLELRGTDCMTFKWVDYKGTIYKVGMVVVVGAQDLCSLFGEVVTIIANGHDVCPLLVCTVLLNIGLSEHVLGYEVEPTEDWICIKISDLLDSNPLYAHTMANGGKYVVLHYSI